MVADGLDTSLLFRKTLITLHALVKLGILIVTDVHKVFLDIKDFLLIDVLIVVLDNVRCCFLDVMKSNRQTNNLQLLLMNTSIIKYSLFICFVELLFEFSLDLDDFIAYTLQVNGPLFTLLIDRVL